MSGANVAAPAVSVLMVARNTGPFIGDAIASARAQSFADIEIVVVDDASSDDTRAIAMAHAGQDARVRVLDGPCAGLSAVRNASLAAARGQWVLILDSDDLLAPGHVARLVEAAARSGAEMVATNMTAFCQDNGQWRVERFASGPDWASERSIGPAEFFRRNCLYGGDVALGYLKPLFSRAFLEQHGLRYDATLRVGEDFDLVIRAMLAGGRYVYLPSTSYFYRRHAGSTSARLPVSSVEALLQAGAAYALPQGEIAQAAAGHRRSLAVALRFGRAVEAIKARDLPAALRWLGASPAVWRQMARSVNEGVSRRLRGFGQQQVQDAAVPSAAQLLALGSAG